MEITKRMTALLLAGTLLLPFATTAWAAGNTGSAPDIVDETFSPIDDDTMDSMGYLFFRADPPVGFEGIIQAELRREGSGVREMVELTSLEDYRSGVWLTEGRYQVVSGSVKDSDHFSVSWDSDEIVISRDTDASLTFTLTDDGGTEAEIAAKQETFSPDILPEPETSAETAPLTEPGTEPPETVEILPEKPAVFSARRLLIDVLAAGIFAGVVFLGSYIVRKHRENET